jgi:hypothetical protein
MMLVLVRRLAPIACVLASGCYIATTTPPAGVATGQQVHLELNDEGTRQLTGVLGPRTLSLDGRVTARTDTSLDVAVTDITRIGGGEETWHGASITVPTRALGRTQARRFAAVQTVLVAGLGVATLFFAARALKGSEDLGSGTRGGGQNPGK